MYHSVFLLRSEVEAGKVHHLLSLYSGVNAGLLDIDILRLAILCLPY